MQTVENIQRRDSKGKVRDLTERCLKLSKTLSLTAILLPFLAAAGWILDISLLKQVHPVLPPMQPNTIVGLVLLAIAILLSREGQSGIKRQWSDALAVVVSLLGLLTLGEYLTGVSLGIDRIFVDDLSLAGQSFPGRPSPQAAVNFTLIGISLLYQNLRLPSHVGQICTLAVGANAIVAMTGYIFSTEQYHGFPVYAPAIGMAVHTAVAFIMLAIALLFSRPRDGMMSLMTSETRSGGIARRVLLAGIVAPPLVGMLTRLGVVIGLFDVGVQTSLFGVIIVGLIVRITWKAASYSERDELLARASLEESKTANENLKKAIDERRVIENALRLSEAKATGIVSISADAIISIDEGQHITMFNDGAEKIFGYTKAEALGASLDLLLPARFHSTHRQLVDNFAAGQQMARSMGERNATISGRRKNGEEFPADASISKVEVEGKEILTVALRDVSNQKRIENEQRFLADVGSILASSLEYEKTLDNIMQLAVRDLADFCIIYAIEKNTATKRSKVVSRDPAKSWVCDLFLNLSFDQAWQNSVDSTIETRTSLLVEQMPTEQIESASYSEKHLKAFRAAGAKSFILSPIIAHGRPLGAIKLIASSSSRGYSLSDLPLVEELARRAAIAIENAQLHRKAQSAKLIADNIPAMMAYWDKDQRCQFANRSYIDWFGFDPEMLVGRTMHDLLGPSLYEKNLPYIRGALAGKRQSFERDLKYRMTGEMRHTSALYIPEIGINEVLGFFVLVFDVTDLKNAQLVAMEERETALAAVRTREDVLSIISHDLKNPLASIGLVAQHLQRSDQIELRQVQDYANRVQRSVGQMNSLIGDLLDFGKIHAGTFSVELYREAPIDVILPAADGVRTLAEAKRQQFEVDISPTLPSVACDSSRIGQVLSNLLGNAVKFTPAGGTVRLIARQTNDEVLISVSDTGPGIPADHLPKVFDRYWQAKETKQLGSGLGLAIAKGIIDAHGARIWAVSQVGKGSCFSFTLPLANTETKNRASSPRPSETRSKDRGRSLEGIHVMIVDDSPDNLLLMRRLLESAGAKVTEANSVSEALAKLTKTKPDVLLTDIEMPNEDGYDLIEKIHHLSPEEGRDIPIAALTAHDREEDLRRLEDAGFDMKLSKPIDLQKTVAAVKELASKSRTFH